MEHRSYSKTNTSFVNTSNSMHSVVVFLTVKQINIVKDMFEVRVFCFKSIP